MFSSIGYTALHNVGRAALGSSRFKKAMQKPTQLCESKARRLRTLLSVLINTRYGLGARDYSVRYITHVAAVMQRYRVPGMEYGGGPGCRMTTEYDS